MELRNTICLTLAVLLSAAVNHGVTAQWKGTVRDSAGVTIISNTDQGSWNSSTLWRVEEELRIGVAEGDPNYQFGRIGWITVGSDRTIYVLDQQGQHVRAFSSEGQYLNTFGGPGAGPGELGAGVIFVLTGPGDTLFVPDVVNRRVNLFTPSGSEAGSFPLDLQKGLPTVWKGTSTGVVACQVRPLNLPQPTVVAATSTRDTTDAIVLYDTKGSAIDTVLKFPSGKTLNLGGSNPEINLYSPEPVWHLADDMKVLYGVNDNYRIWVYSAAGELERIIEMPFEQVPVGERDKRLIMEFLEEAWVDAGVPPSALTQLRSFVHFGEFIPAFATAQTGPAGTIWVQHSQPASELSDEELEGYNPLEASGAPEWDVFDTDGKFLGVVTMPPRVAPRLFRGDRVYGVARGEYDVQYVVRLRIVGM
jgi:hypothetical protein